jgi:hypothetical protein
MALPLSLEETAAEIGRSADWLQRHWPRLVRERGFPLPLHDEKPYVWDPDHLQAWKDLRLTSEVRERLDQMRGKVPDLAAKQDAVVEQHRQALAKRFGNE